LQNVRKGAVALAVIAAVGGGSALAQTPDEVYTGARFARFKAHLNGYQAVPSISTRARGTFRARVVGREIAWTLSYRGIEGGPVTQAHVHFGRRGTNGDIAVWLCSNIGGAPAGTPACPATRGTLRGTIRASDVVGPANQGIGPGATDELIRAMKARATYANVHSTQWPMGELRGQIKPSRRSR
jgi:hypothetical protein